MNREIYDITSEPRGGLYQKLLSIAQQHCDQFLFVDVPEPRFGENDTSFKARSLDLVRELQPHLVRIEKSKSWPGTRMGERPGLDVFARIYYFRLNSSTTPILTRVADHLYAWRWPELPTDLCLIRPDGDAWLVNIAVDEESYFQITKEEAGKLGSLLPELGLKRVYMKH